MEWADATEELRCDGDRLCGVSVPSASARYRRPNSLKLESTENLLEQLRSPSRPVDGIAVRRADLGSPARSARLAYLRRLPSLRRVQTGPPGTL